MQRHSLFLKILSLVIISALLSLRLSSFSEDLFVVPVEDAIFDAAFIAAEDSPTDGKPKKANTQRGLDIVLPPIEELRYHGGWSQLTRTPVVTVLNLKDIHSKIFIPPETVS